jgi:hypothetical protein
MRRFLDWWYDYRWHHPEALAFATLISLALLAIGGFLAEHALHPGASARAAIPARTVLISETRTVAGGRVVRFKVRRLIHFEPVYRREVVTRNGQTITVRKLVGRRAVTVSRTILHSRTATRSQTVTGPTQTVTGPVRTVTGPTRTTTVVETQTETVPTTITQTETVTEPTTVTVTAPQPTG